MKRNQAKVKTKTKIYGRICEECKEAFNAKRKHAKFCDDICRFNNWDKKNPRISLKAVIKPVR